MTDRPTRITKVLSANDTGETGGHQAGMLVPKEGRILAFFPSLDPSEKNGNYKDGLTLPPDFATIAVEASHGKRSS